MNAAIEYATQITTIGVMGQQPDMTRAEALNVVNKIKMEVGEINRRIARLRLLLHDLNTRKGWKALGYKSAKECYPKVFGKSMATINRWLASNLTELEVNGSIGEIEERILRPLTRAGYTADTRKLLFEIAQHVTGGQATSGVMQQVVDTIGEAIITQVFQDGEGQQHPLWQRLDADMVGRIYEMKMRQREFITRNHQERVYLVSSTQANTAAIAGNVLSVSLDNQIEVGNAIALLKQHAGKRMYVNLWVVDEREVKVDKETGEIVSE